jgi:hypothetical protein
VQAWSAWDRFWFTPANPTTWGLIRICAGLLTLYVHLAYSYDLFAFFGKDAWVSWNRVTELHQDSPRNPMAMDWYGKPPSLYIPDDFGLRTDLFTWLEQLPDDKAGRLRVIEYIKHPDNAPVGYHLPKYVLDLNPGPPADAEPRSNEEYRQFFAGTRWHIIHFIKNLPDDKIERQAKIAYMKEWQVDPDTLWQRGLYTWSVWFHITDPSWMVATHVAILVVMFLFAIGFCTRVTSVLTWLAAVSYIQRSTVTLFGGDTMMNILLIYLMIGPSGAALSVDRLLARWWQVRRARQAGLPVPASQPAEASISANFVLRLLQIHFCIIYLAAGTSKLLGGNWWNGTAIYYTMANYEFAPLRYPFYLNMMRRLAQNRVLWEFVMAGGTFSTLALELGLPFLVWNRRLRPVLVAASMTLHIFIAIFMGLVAFSLLMATMVMSFIPGEVVEQLLDRLRRMVLGEAKSEKEPTAAVGHESAGSTAAEDKTELEPVLQTAGQVETAITGETDRGKRKKEKSR